jgi:hypothetical protein
MRSDERTDEQMDAALLSYAAPPEMTEPRVAVARVMEQVRAAEWARRRVWMWAVTSATAFLAALVALGMAWSMRGTRDPEIAWAPKPPGVAHVAERADGGRGDQESGRSAVARVAARPRLLPGARTSGVRPTGAGDGEDRQEVAQRTLPKLEVFPTPRPLSPEEQALVALATQTSPEVERKVAEAEKHAGDPIAIAELKIRPLSEDGKQDSNKER